MRTSFFILVSCLFFSLSGFTQTRDSIIYVTPDSVNQKILDYLKTSTSPDAFYAALHKHNDTTSILISSYGKEFLALADLIRKSNRYIKVGEKNSIPVLLHEDFMMSQALHTITKKGTEYEAIKTILVRASGFLVEYKGFYGDASIIKAEYYQN